MKFSKEVFKYEFTRNQATNEEIHENILEGMNVHGANFIILICAIIIASVGLNMNATAVIIGAMLISPLMGSIIGIGYGVGTYNIKLLRDAFKILILSIFLSILTSTLYFSITPITTAGSEILSRTSPTIWDVIIAFVGGIAGMIGLTRNKTSNIIPGVAIATALMPPLCTAGYGLATKNYSIFFGAGYLFCINCFFIITSTFIVTKALNLPVVINLDDAKQRTVKKIILVSAIIVIIPSLFSAFNMIQETIDESNLNAFIKEELKDQYVLQKNINEKNHVITLAVIGGKITNNELKRLNESLNNYGFENMDLVVKQDGGNAADIEKYINEISNQSNTFIKDNSTSNKLQEESSNTDNKMDIKNIAKELKVLYPKIEKVYGGYLVSEDDDTKEIPTLVLYSNDNKLNNSIKTIEEWFKARTKQDQVNVYIQKPKPQQDIKTDNQYQKDLNR